MTGNGEGRQEAVGKRQLISRSWRLRSCQMMESMRQNISGFDEKDEPALFGQVQKMVKDTFKDGAN